MVIEALFWVCAFLRLHLLSSGKKYVAKSEVETTQLQLSRSVAERDSQAVSQHTAKGPFGKHVSQERSNFYEYGNSVLELLRRSTSKSGNEELQRRQNEHI